MSNQEISELSRDQHVAIVPDGIDTWGVFFELVEFQKPTGGIVGETPCVVKSQIRVFTALNMVCTYNRQIEQTRTVWRRELCSSPQEAIAHSVKMVNGATDSIRTMRGAAILVQLTDADVKLIESDQIPSARFRGNHAHRKIYGDLDEASMVPGMWNLAINSTRINQAMVAGGRLDAPDPEPEF